MFGSSNSPMSNVLGRWPHSMGGVWAFDPQDIVHDDSVHSQKVRSIAMTVQAIENWNSFGGENN